MGIPFKPGIAALKANMFEAGSCPGCCTPCRDTVSYCGVNRLIGPLGGPEAVLWVAGGPGVASSPLGPCIAALICGPMATG